ncbi:hypothetical protein P3X46_034685 [Hevea brasiliensis]|uniref:Malectin-like domain-containing protein n=1 Tax=Hevea brasiliensis TaxID=3981 RepID=A0ABQ9KA75_HEVBR|nr:hypothetical protein P3X46_034685 [Hevea brasiliensis]
MDGWQRFFLFSVLWLIFAPVYPSSGSSKVAAAANNEPAGRRKLAAGNPGSISIDCGVNEDYFDENIGLLWKSDRDFISSGENHDAEPGFTSLEALLERQLLELHHVNDSIYRSKFGSLSVARSFQLSNPTGWIFRYKDDVFHRIWNTLRLPNSIWVNATPEIQPQEINDSYKLPIEVLRTAAQPKNDLDSLAYNISFSCVQSCNFYVYFHFAEIVEIPHDQRRVFTVTLNDVTSEPISLEYLKPQTIILNTQEDIYFTIDQTSNSGLPPILNAFEILEVVELPLSPTDQADVDAIMAIMQSYNINGDDLQGDPCVPKGLSWNGLNCSYDNNPPRIILLDLSSRKLTGEIAPSLSALKAIHSLDLSYNKLTGILPNFLSELLNLTFLDLSYNELTGPVPEFLAQLPNLNTLNLSGNKLTGSIPQSLIEKFNNGTLQLSFM